MLAFLFAVLSLSAQDRKDHCGTDAIHLKLMNEDAKYKMNFEKSTADWLEYAPKHLDDWKPVRMKTNNQTQSPPNVVTLSVVFHDVSASGTYLLPSAAPVSNYQYIIDKLNLVYDGTNVNGNTAGNNTFIQFCLATRTQSGDTFTVASNQKSSSVAGSLDAGDNGQHQTIAGVSFTASYFNTTKYINVYIVDDILGSVAGFAYGPSAHGQNYDGIYIERQWLLNNASLNLNMNVFVHEMGHYLGLLHTFGICNPSSIGALTDPITGYNPCSCDNGNCLFNGDMICDTAPNMLIQSGYGIGSFPNSCHTDAIAYPSIANNLNPITTDVVDPKDNYMDYGIWSLEKLFTTGQITRMQFMIDPIVGPRKSLLGQAVCANCALMTNCNFSIIPNAAFTQLYPAYPPRYELYQVAGATPAVPITVNSSCSASLNYTWKLELLGGNSNTFIAQGTGNSYTTASGLVPGNYQITFTATLASNAQCIETTTFAFTINPTLTSCILQTPISNSLANWVSAGWTRTSFTGGWNNNGVSYPAGSQHFDNTQGSFDTAGFDVLPITPGGTLSADPVLGSYMLPTTANINQVIRVGRNDEQGGGRAFYARKTITVNRNNCRFRVWILGGTQGVAANTAYPFVVYTGPNNDAAFGILNKYHYCSTVNNSSATTLNTTIGFDDTNFVGAWYFNALNDVVSQRVKLGPGDFVSNGTYSVTNGWKSVIMDFSEYVDLNADTEITLTFFAHSNIATSALQNAYAYYGFECLGGGLPKPFSFDIPDTNLACSSPDTQSCKEFNIPAPAYFNLGGYGVGHNNLGYNFDTFQVFRLVGGVPTTLMPITFPNNSTFKICLDQSDAPFQDFRIFYNTMHGMVTDDFRLYVGFYNNLDDCTTGDQINTTFHPNLTNGDILLCGTNALPLLHLTNTCITVPFTYQWQRKGDGSSTWVDIAGAVTDPTDPTNPAALHDTLQLVYNPASTATFPDISNNYNPFVCNNYRRVVKYKEPYCGNPKTKKSDEFHIYNRQELFLAFNSVNENDICFGDTYDLTLNQPTLNMANNYASYSCSLPGHFATDVAAIQNTIHFQLYDPVTHQPFGNVIDYTFNGAFNNYTSIPGLTLHFTFNNINPATGNTPLFVPTATQLNFPYDIRITGTYLNCPLDADAHTYHIGDINYSLSAVGGVIGYNCTTPNGISSVDDGVTYGGYGWEFSTDNVTFSSITGGPSTDTLPQSFIASLSTTYFPATIYIRRKSNGTGQCLNPKYSNVVVIATNAPGSIIFNTSVLPTQICHGGTAPVLPGVSSNGVPGTWNVATVSNTVTGNYIFTPLQGYCLPPYTYHLTIRNLVAPAFAELNPICAGAPLTLPGSSLNFVSGHWTPAVNNMVTTEYTFHPNGSIPCVIETTMTVEVYPSSAVSFANSHLFDPICAGATAPVLPTVDDNGVVGTWSPPTVSNTIGNTYTFTPTGNPCVTPASYVIGVIPQCGFTLAWGSEVSCQWTTDGRKLEVDIVDGPCLRVCENSTIHYELHGNLASIASTTWTITGGTPSNETSTSLDITWSSATFCALQGVIHLTNGTEVIINKCIEKLESPHASFGVYPLPAGEFYTTCVNTPTYFENYSFANSGDDNLYYNWYFSDGTTSNEFEPIHIFHEPGIYTIDLVVSNGCSCVDRVTGVISVEKGDIQIDCPSVTCEGSRETYTIDSSYESCPDINWQVEGGTVLSYQNNNTQAQIMWGTGNADGFGYITLTSSSCSHCASIVKIPIVQQVGTIKGDLYVCEKTQNLYSLPQWPTTDFNWTLVDNGTGAILALTNQRNEIILQSQSQGVVELYCTYTNTLLGCGGTAHLTIHVQPGVRVEGPTESCVGTPATYNLLDNAGTLLPSVTWTVDGPALFQQTGTNNPFQIAYPGPGVYYITASGPNQCGSTRFQVTVKAQPATPTSVLGPNVVCPGTPVTYTVSPPPGATPHWTVLNGSIIGSSVGNSILVNFNPAATTNFVVQVWYEQDGCTSGIRSVVIGRDLPNLAITHADTTVCGSTYGNYSIANTQADSYTWSIVPATAGSIESGQNTNSVHVLWNQQAGTATINLQVRKCGQMYPLNPITVTIISAPSITITGSTDICSGSAANFSFNQTPSGTFSSVLWNFGDGATGTTNPVSHLYQTPLTGSINYTVSATVTGANGCPMNAFATKNVVVYPSPVVAITPASNLNLCGQHSPGDYTYSVTMQGGFAATDQITWYHNSGVLTTGTGPGAATIDVQTTGVGSYYATVTNSHCTSTTNTFYVTNNCAGCVATQVVDATVESNLNCQHVIAHPTALPAGYTNVSWSASLPGATILSNDVTSFEAENVAPGEYPLQFTATYNNGSQLCTTTKNLSFIIPYKANLKYQLSCGVGNNYNVKLVDFSTYYANTPITQWWFTIDGGTNWYAGTAGAGGIREYNTTLAPGTYTIGIRIATSGYAFCETFMTLVVPGKPNANFTNELQVCAGSPVHCALSSPQPGNQYVWNFGDFSTNLQPNPSKTYSTSGTYFITLTVSDQFGCSITSAPHPVIVTPVSMAGSIQVTPANVCQGGTMNLHFNSTGAQVPTNYAWYLNSTTGTPLANGSSPNLTVNQNGQYLVHLQNSNGCFVYNQPAVTAAFIPLPSTPVITGNAIACANSPIKLKVPANSSVTYSWSINNGPSQPQWSNLSSIVDQQSTPGTYTYSVVATVTNSGTSCSSAAGTFQVTVVAAPDMPILSLNTVVCTPYQVEVVVTNPQTDVGYYWSNGGLGTSTVMSHDGPLQVRAVLNECVSKSQIDLPIDLDALAWIFPKGCYKSCDKPTGYIIGPLGSFEKWEWLENDNVVSSGASEMLPLTNLNNSSYSMFLDNGYCQQTTGYATFTGKECEKCEFRFEVKKISCVKVNNQNVYQIEFAAVNPYTSAAWATFTAPNGEGSFMTNTLSLPSGISTQFLYFNGQIGFNGGAVTIHVAASHDGKDCVQDFGIVFPESCEKVEECKFEYKVGKISCVKTETTNIYRFELEITNPYAINSTTTVSVPTSVGTISPSPILSPSGVLLHNFYFYPATGWSGGGIPVTVTSTIGTAVCTKYLDIKMPSECATVKICDFNYESINVECHRMSNGQYGYTVSMIINNPYSTPATIGLSAHNHEGYFVPSTLNLVAGSSIQTFDFYPNGGFMGGNVNITIEGHYKDEICINDIRIGFPHLCCPTCRTVDLDDPKVTDKNLLVVAPNPANENTTIFYNFVETGGNKTILLTDLLGRTLLEWHPSTAKGTLEVDCSRYAQGHYLILMKQDNAVIENTKLIKH
ncbi:MAG: PKD domain-containing protein [Flavobacterium sp.]|uniref:PKD domain-containing protein n=1 Tax=Flavobacterium sp. TaxID=239 RepID=UPI00326752E7